MGGFQVPILFTFQVFSKTNTWDFSAACRKDEVAWAIV